jgi:hypothetical protein
MKKLVVFAAVALFGMMAVPAHAYTHPCIPHTADDLATIKASLNQEPWKSGYAQLAAYGQSSLNYNMQGPFAGVSRQGPYDANLGPWNQDMLAVNNLARMWYFTGNEAYAQKARDILIAWATTNTVFDGSESGLALGDAAGNYAGGASILRGTWPGWTAADTTTVKNYFANVLWPVTGCEGNVLGPCNKGAIYMKAGIAIALFCDDTAKFNHVLNLYRTFHGSGLMDTLPTGQLGETGRNAGHAWGDLDGLAFVADCAWKQGVDLFGELDNRLLACGEYFARETFHTDNPFVPYGATDWAWIFQQNNVGFAGNRSTFYVLQNAYKNRKNLPTPWIDRKLQEQGIDGYNFMNAKSADFSTATMSPATFPGVSLASSGLTLTTLGNNSGGRSLSYANGVWTLTGLGNDVWSDTTDDAQFAYKQMSGDCAIVARLTSIPAVNGSTKTGLMIRDNLSASVSQRAWVGITPGTSGTTYMQSRTGGWTESWGGGGYATRSHDWSTLGLPYWFKIERRGLQIATFCSQDGTSWHPVTCAYYGNLPSTLYIGLFICNGGGTTTATAQFDRVAFTGGSGGLVTTPYAPKGILVDGSSKFITLRWLPSFGATAYNVLRSTTSGSGYAAIASNLSASTTTYVDTSAAAGTTYYYVVQAVNSAGTSGNSPQFYGSRLPAQMANLAFSGTATASSSASGNEVAAKAFDTSPGTKWFATAATGWLQYDFGASNGQVVKRYTVSCADVNTRDPKDWQFQGSQDGSSWTTLNSQSGQTFAYRLQQKTYDIGNTTAYRYYRLNVTANNGATQVAVAELGLWSDTGRTIPDGRYAVVSRKSNKVVDLVNGSTADGTDAIQWGWNGGTDQKWDVAWLGNGQYQLTGVASGKLLEISDGSTANGGWVQIWPSTGSNWQKWTIVPANDGAFKVVNVNSGKVLDVSGGSTADGAAIKQYDDIGASNQQWLMSITTP